MQARNFFIVVLLILTGFFHGCSSSDKRYIPSVDKSELKVFNVKIHRYGKALFEIDTNQFSKGLKSIQSDFLLFLNADLEDTANLNQLKAFVADTLNRFLYKESMHEFPDLKPLEKNLSVSMSYYHYYFPSLPEPSFYSYISGSYYEEPVLVADKAVLIGLDNYLGGDFVHYARLQIPKYKTHWMIKEEVPVDVMTALYRYLPFSESKPKNLLDMMVSAGKRLFYLDAMMPGVADSLKIRYTTNQLNWVEKNEKNVWAFLIAQEMLFSADFMQTNKLMQDGPFTKGFDGDAPARIGEWMGWRIVSAYMKKHPEVTLKELLLTKDAQMILNKSGYKP